MATDSVEFATFDSRDSLAMIQFVCPQCDKKFSVSEAHAGKTAKCGCGNRFRVPNPHLADSLKPAGSVPARSLQYPPDLGSPNPVHLRSTALPESSPGVPPLPAPSAARDALAAAGPFGCRSYTVRRKVFTLFGKAFHLLDESNNVIGYSRQKAFKLKEDIRVFSDEQMMTTLLTIQARNIVDFSATYDVYDPRMGERPLGSLRRRGWKSLVRDEWLLFSSDGAEIGMIREEGGLALLRRLIAWVDLFSPQRYSLSVADGRVASLSTNRNPFVYRLRVSITDELHTVSPQMVLAGAILLAAIEGKQA